MELLSQEYWSELPFPPPEDLPYAGIKPTFSAFSELESGLFTFVMISVAQIPALPPVAR